MRFPARWLAFSVLLTMSLVLAHQFLMLRAQADASLELVAMLARTSAAVSGFEEAEMHLLYEAQDGPGDALGDLHRARAAFVENLDHISQHRWANIDREGLLSAYRQHSKLLDQELAMLEAGHAESARWLDHTAVDPAYDRLKDKMEDVQRSAQAAATEHVHKANVRLFGLAVIMITMIAGGVVIDSRFRQRLLLAQRETLAESERRFRLLTERASDVVLIVNPDGLIRYATPSVETVLGITPERMCGRSLLDLVVADDRPAISEHLRNAQQGKAGRLEFRGLVDGSSWVYLEAMVRDLTDAHEVGGLVVNLRDIDDQKRAQTQLLHSALHDSLTSLPNRVMFTERLETALDRAARSEQRCVAVLFIDVDDFQVINNSVGHQVGDIVIVEVAQRLTTCLRRTDTVSRLNSSTGILARLGGDEFSVMLEDIHDAADAVRVCERILVAMRQPFAIGDRHLYATVSVGVATSETGMTADTLMRNADVAMYRAKNRGKAQFAIFDPHMHERVTERLKLEMDLREALERQEFVLYYQPIVSLKTGRVDRVEALLRWNRGGAMVPPGDFIGVAEESGLIRPIGDWVLRDACRQVMQWNKGTEQPVMMCVNISGKQFTHPAFLDEVMTAMADTGVNPAYLEFEITEGVAMEDAEHTRHTLHQLQAIGVHLALDDFGTGYSSLSYLRRFAVDTLKIDRSFVSDLPSNRENMAIVQTIVELARILSLQTVAEGVETSEQLRVLDRFGCSFAQGFLLARPQPAQQIAWAAKEVFAQLRPESTVNERTSSAEITRSAVTLAGSEPMSLHRGRLDTLDA
jgi:diguanylate cyclase (GGDEF)-like protein/PAS domain S-box-containing protein